MNLITNSVVNPNIIYLISLKKLTHLLGKLILNIVSNYVIDNIMYNVFKMHNYILKTS